MRKFLINISNYIEYLNKKGIPIPTVRDPKTQRGSVSLTLVAISSGLVIVGCVNKLFGKDLIDMSRSLDFFYASCALYWGRRLQKSDSQGPQDPDI